MAKVEKIGRLRPVVGAHYGTLEFIAQRLTAIVMAVYTVILMIGYLTMSGFSYAGWKGLFTFKLLMIPMGQMLATAAILSLAWHVWIGVRDIWMDYVKCAGVRLALYVLTLAWILGSVFYFLHILWRN
ncbi:MAG: succinate dehydrogenase, hydrophobic membrane anchor protein [Burkholderiaceae bacterium]|jgi:succinate dehydrogenase / fumarate reductase membrane anchor subunit|nr:succinate dehydrogenase, hydrophobic membrane anchor protein [Burkholderiaceae bacterium]